jgi:hypothetical protein
MFKSFLERNASAGSSDLAKSSLEHYMRKISFNRSSLEDIPLTPPTIVEHGRKSLVDVVTDIGIFFGIFRFFSNFFKCGTSTLSPSAATAAKSAATTSPTTPTYPRTRSITIG